MKAVELWDVRDDVFLTLRQVLAPVAAECVTSTWDVSSYMESDGEKYFWLGGDGDDELDAIADTGKRLSGPEFMAIAEKTSQVIWGVFRGYRANLDAPWITLQAIDSTFWRCETENIQVRQALVRAFDDVRLNP